MRESYLLEGDLILSEDGPRRQGLCAYGSQMSNFQLGNKTQSSGERFWLDSEVVEVDEAKDERQKETRGQVQSSRER